MASALWTLAVSAVPKGGGAPFEKKLMRAVSNHPFGRDPHRWHRVTNANAYSYFDNTNNINSNTSASGSARGEKGDIIISNMLRKRPALVTLAALAVVQPAKLIFRPIASVANRFRRRPRRVSPPPTTTPPPSQAAVPVVVVSSASSSAPILFLRPYYEWVANNVGLRSSAVAVALTALVSGQHNNSSNKACTTITSTCSYYASSGALAFAAVVIPDASDVSAMWRSVATVTLATLAVMQPAALVAPIMEQVDILRERLNLPKFTFPMPNMQYFDLPRAVARVRMALAVRNATELSQDESIHSFKLNGLGWHHKAISSHLRALEKRAEEGKITDPHLETAYQFVLAKVWRTYNSLEKEIFFPWMLKGTDGDERVISTLKEFSVERDRIERSAERLRSLVRDCVTTESNLHAQFQAQGYAYTGSGERSRKASEKLARALGNLAEDVERLHLAERQILFPIIAAKFPLAEQRSLTNRMVDAMETRLSRLTLVNYFHMVKNDPVELENFRDQVPGPVRALLGFWKSQLYDGTPLEALNEEAARLAPIKER